MSTKERLLDAAESLYAAGGIEATSLRAITAAARANLAAVHYHFGSKEALTEAVFSRRLEPLNRERLALLDELEEKSNDDSPPSVDDVLRAFLGPPIRMSRDRVNQRFIRLMGRMYSETSDELKKQIAFQFREIIRRFSTALSRAAPHLDDAEIHWRFQFSVGAMVHTVCDPVRLEQISGGLCDPSDVDATLTRLVSFLAAGFRSRGLPADASHTPRLETDEGAG